MVYILLKSWNLTTTSAWIKYPGIDPILKVYFSFSDENEQTDEQVVDEETAQEKRLRLAKQYLAQLEKEGILEGRY